MEGCDDTTDSAFGTGAECTSPPRIPLLLLVAVIVFAFVSYACDFLKRQRKHNNSGDESGLGEERSTKKVTMFDCAVCLDQVEPILGYRLGGCLHMFCRECLYGYIKSKLADKSVKSLVCPDTTCENPFSTRDVRACTIEIGDAASWKEYEEQATGVYLDSASDSRTNDTILSSSLRRCPTEHCNFTFEFEPGPTGQLFICPTCDDGYCLNCLVMEGKVGPAHDGTCKEVLEEVRTSRKRRKKLEAWKKENAAADKRFQKLLRREKRWGTTKACPNCQSLITKNGGCNHMHCTCCDTNFDWNKIR